MSGVFKPPNCVPVFGQDSTAGVGNVVSADPGIDTSSSSGSPVFGWSSASLLGPCTIWSECCLHGTPPPGSVTW